MDRGAPECPLHHAFSLTLWACSWFARKPDWRRDLTVAVLFAAGLASKPMVITPPFVLFLLDYWPLSRVQGENAGSTGMQPKYSWSRLVLENLPMLVLSAASAGVAVQAQQSGGAVP